MPIPWTEIENARKRQPTVSPEVGGVRQASGAEPPLLERGARRYALIIANENYTDLPALQTPRLEAEALLDVLAENGFITQIHHNLNLEEFRSVVDRFSQALQPKDFVLFYYAGCRRNAGHQRSAAGDLQGR